MTVSKYLVGFAAFGAASCQSLGDLKKTAYANARSMLTSSYDDQQAENKVSRADAYFDAGDYDRARPLYNDVAGNQTNPVLLAEKARYMQGECFRMARKYPDAVDTYHKMLVDFPGGAYRERACNQMFAIADYWLDDTRDEIQAERDGKSSYTKTFARLASFDSTKPTLDREGRALQALEYVHTNDITGPNADKALYWSGYVNFYRGNYQDADHHFSLLVDMHKDSALRPQATELAIISKNNSTGGSSYDGQKAAEALQLVHHAEASMPEFRQDGKAEFLTRQKLAIRMQQADKDFKMAEYYERTRHPGSAYFYYELVKRRYPGTKYAELATAKLGELKANARPDDGKDPLDVARERFELMFNMTSPEPSLLRGPQDSPPPVSLPDGPQR